MSKPAARFDIESVRASSRRRFAEELRATAYLTSDALVDAFAKVPRERFVGHGPWQICVFADDGGWSSPAPVHAA